MNFADETDFFTVGKNFGGSARMQIRNILNGFHRTFNAEFGSQSFPQTFNIEEIVFFAAAQPIFGAVPCGNNAETGIFLRQIFICGQIDGGLFKKQQIVVAAAVVFCNSFQHTGNQRCTHNLLVFVQRIHDFHIFSKNVVLRQTHFIPFLGIHKTICQNLVGAEAYHVIDNIIIEFLFGCQFALCHGTVRQMNGNMVTAQHSYNFFHHINFFRNICTERRYGNFISFAVNGVIFNSVQFKFQIFQHTNHIFGFKSSA